MLKTPVIHPQLLEALGAAGHLGRVLMTDANYPNNTRPNPAARIVWANFAPGVVDGVTMLGLLCRVIPIETVHVMQPERTGLYAIEGEPPVWAGYREVLAEHAGYRDPMIELEKPVFNEHARGDDVCLVVATGERQGFANLLLTIGVVS